MDVLKIFATVIFFVFYFSSSGVTQSREKLGIDRIDAAFPSEFIANFNSALMERTADLGTKHIKIWVPWIFIDGSPPYNSKPKMESGYIVVPGIRMSGWHKYKIKELDAAVAEAEKKNFQIAFGIHGPPLWPRGAGVCEYDLGTHLPCGVILQSHFEEFKNALFDFSYYMTMRYPEIEYWILYNEPNLPYAFLPQQPWPGGNLLNAYMELVYWPVRDGLYAGGNFVKLVGPEITLLDVKNEFGSTNWNEDWIEPILRDYPNHFDVLGVHCYSVDANQTLNKMSRLKLLLEKFPASTQKVWLTEFNFGTDKESLTQNDLYKFTNILRLLKDQWWERSYFFSFIGNVVYEDYWRFGEPRQIFFWLKKLLEN